MSARRPVHACLLVPGLFGPLTAPGVDAETRAALLAGVSLETLEAVLSRAEIGALPCVAAGLEGLLAAVFGLPTTASSGFPAAALTRQMDAGDAGDAVWLRADPVHLRAALADASLLHHTSPTPGLQLSISEAAALCGLLNEALAEESLALLAPTPQRWYLHLEQPPDACFVSPYQIAGGSMRDRLPGGPQGGYWRRLLTVTQTVLHECPVNVAREAAGAPPLNSLWFFGAGRLPASAAATPVAVWGAHELCEALALHAGAAASALPSDAAAWLRAGAAPGEHLFFFQDCHEAVCAVDAGAWCAAVQRLEHDWLGPLVAALRDGVLASLRLVTDDGRTFRLTRAALRRFWRRRRSLAVIAAASVRDDQ